MLTYFYLLENISHLSTSTIRANKLNGRIEKLARKEEFNTLNDISVIKTKKESKIYRSEDVVV